MHYLHNILVNISDMKRRLNIDGPITKNDIRLYAAAETECFADEVYDWRSIATAGRWSDIYPENVMLAKDDINSFVKVLERLSEHQRSLVEYHIKEIRDDLGEKSLLDDIEDRLRNGPDTPYDRLSYDLDMLVSMLLGRYTSDACYYNTSTYSSKMIRDKDIETIKEKPEDWALVFFDLHD